MHNLPSIFYCGFERAAKANDIMLSLNFKQPLSARKCWATYVDLIKRHPALRSAYRYDTTTQRYRWTFLSEEELSILMEREKAAQHQLHVPGQVFSCFDPTGVSLPLRFRITGSHTAIFLISHVFADGRTTFAWLDEWCKSYASIEGDISPDWRIPSLPDVPAAWNNPGEPENTAVLIKAGVMHFARLALASLLTLRHKCVDLSHDRVPQTAHTDSFVVGYHFTQQESLRIIQGARDANVSTAAYIHRALCSALFALYPDCAMQRFGIASDVSKSFPQADPLAPGCLINPYLAQVTRNKPLLPQLARIYDEARKGAPVALLVLSSRLVPSHRFVENHVYRTTLKPTSKRQWLERLSFIYSHVRDPQHAHTQQCVESVSGHTKSQTIFVASTSLNGHLSLEFCATQMVFSPADVERWFMAVKQSLLANTFAY